MVVATVLRSGLDGSDSWRLSARLQPCASKGIRPASRTSAAQLRQLAREAGARSLHEPVLSRCLDFAIRREIVETVGALVPSLLETVMKTDDALE
jgi:hypothetical protein